MNRKEYLDFVQKEYFAECKDQTVLEIGPNDAAHTRLILNESPTNLTVIEPNVSCNDILKECNVDQIINDDANLYLTKNKKEYDVVVCCGVLYHLHSPLYLLELIVNQCNPKKIILDCTIDQKNISFMVEEDNICGNRFTVNQWKSSRFNLVAPFDIITKSMYNMGYRLIKKDITENTEWKSKDNVWIALWEKIVQ